MANNNETNREITDRQKEQIRNKGIQENLQKKQGLSDVTATLIKQNKGIMSSQFRELEDMNDNLDLMSKQFANSSNETDKIVEKQLEGLKEVTLEAQQASVAEARKLLQKTNTSIEILQNVADKTPEQEKVLANAEETRRILQHQTSVFNSMKDVVGRQFSDGLGMLAGAMSQSPILAWGVKILGDSIRSRQEAKKERVQAIIDAKREKAELVNESIAKQEQLLLEHKPTVETTSENEQPTFVEEEQQDADFETIERLDSIEDLQGQAVDHLAAIGSTMGLELEIARKESRRAKRQESLAKQKAEEDRRDQFETDPVGFDFGEADTKDKKELGLLGNIFGEGFGTVLGGYLLGKGFKNTIGKAFSTVLSPVKKLGNLFGIGGKETSPQLKKGYTRDGLLYRNEKTGRFASADEATEKKPSRMKKAGKSAMRLGRVGAGIGKNLFTKVLGGLGLGVLILEGVTNMVTEGIMGWKKGGIDGALMGVIKGVLGTLTFGLTDDLMDKAATAIDNFFKNFTFGGLVKSIGEYASVISESIWENTKKAFTWIGDAVSGWAFGLVDKWGEALGLGNHEDAIQGMSDWMSSTFGEGSWLSDKLAGIKAFFEKTKTVLSSFDNFVSWIKGEDVIADPTNGVLSQGELQKVEERVQRAKDSGFSREEQEAVRKDTIKKMMDEKAVENAKRGVDVNGFPLQPVQTPAITPLGQTVTPEIQAMAKQSAMFDSPTIVPEGVMDLDNINERFYNTDLAAFEGKPTPTGQRDQTTPTLAQQLSHVNDKLELNERKRQEQIAEMAKSGGTNVNQAFMKGGDTNVTNVKYTQPVDEDRVLQQAIAIGTPS